MPLFVLGHIWRCSGLITGNAWKTIQDIRDGAPVRCMLSKYPNCCAFTLVPRAPFIYFDDETRWVTIEKGQIQGRGLQLPSVPQQTPRIVSKVVSKSHLYSVSRNCFSIRGIPEADVDKEKYLITFNAMEPRSFWILDLDSKLEPSLFFHG